MKQVVKGKRGGIKTFEVRTFPQLQDALARVPRGFERHHDEAMLLGKFIAEKLTELVDGKPKQHGRKPSAWNEFFAAGMKAGKTPAQIGKEWRQLKVKRAS